MERTDSGRGRHRKAVRYPLGELGFLKGSADEELDAMSRIAADLLQTPIALVSIFDENQQRQFLKGQVGLAKPLSELREIPAGELYCDDVRSSARPLKINDVNRHEMSQRSKANNSLEIAAYLGAPIFSPTGSPIGTLAVIDNLPRSWSDNDVRIIESLARAVSNNIRLRAEVLNSEKMLTQIKSQHQQTARYNALREWIYLSFMAPDLTPQQRFEGLLKASCDALGMEQAVITTVDYDVLKVKFGNSQPQKTPKRGYSVVGTLSSHLMSGPDMICFENPSVPEYGRVRDFKGAYPQAFAGLPLRINGKLYGTLEFSSQKPKSKPWSVEELSLINMIAMLICAHLGFTGRIDELQRSESALLNQLLDSQKRAEQVL